MAEIHVILANYDYENSHVVRAFSSLSRATSLIETIRQYETKTPRPVYDLPDVVSDADYEKLVRSYERRLKQWAIKHPIENENMARCHYEYSIISIPFDRRPMGSATIHLTGRSRRS